MLYWICPECGHECSPAVRECPTCTAAESAPAASGVVQQQPAGSGRDIQELAEKLQVPAVPVETAALPRDSAVGSHGSAANGSQANGSSVHGSSGIVVTVEAIPETLESSASAREVVDHTLDWWVRPLVESARPVASEPPPVVEPASETWHAGASDPTAAAEPLPFHESLAALSANQTRSEVVPRAEDLAPLTGVIPRPALPDEPQTQAPAGEAVRAALPQPAMVALPFEHSELALAPAALVRLQEPPEPALGKSPAPARLEVTVTSLESAFGQPVFDSAQVTPASEPLVQPVYDHALVEEALEQQAQALDRTFADPALETAPEETGAALTEAMALQAQTVVDTIDEQLEAEQAGIRAAAATFQEQPKTGLLAAPPEIVTAPASPAQWIRMPKPVITARRPEEYDFARLSGAPQEPTLNGACLPRQLRTFMEKPTTATVPARKPISLRTWIVSALVATFLTCVFLLGSTILQRLNATRAASAASAAPPPRPAQPAPVAQPIPAVPVVHEHPAARFVEVAGVRVVTSANHKPQLEYIVVNHSGSALTGLDIRIAGRSPDTPSGTAPLFNVSSVIASLGPYQSKEIRTDLDESVRPGAIPDWQSLHTDILVARH